MTSLANPFQSPLTIPFDEIEAGATVRYAVIKEDQQYLSIRDIIMHICGKNMNDAGEVWRKFSLDKKEALSQDLAVYQFPGRGNSLQPVITFPGSIKLVMMLPGKRAQLYRNKFAEIVSRYFNGDCELIHEIKDNKMAGQKRSYSRFAQDVELDLQEQRDVTDGILQHQYIYATKSPAFPGLIKIGRTTNMRARLVSLNTSCAPAPHVVVAITPTLDMFRDEYCAHHFFAESRREGEFFAVTEDEVKEFFTVVLMSRYQEDLLKYVT